VSLNEALYKRIGAILLFLGPVTTLAVSPFSSFDPINLIKLIFVTSLAFSIIGLCLTSYQEIFSRIDLKIWIAASFFVVWMIVAIFASGAPLNQQFWGVFGRNTGFLTYFSLVLVMLGVALVQQQSFYRKLVDVLILTAIPTTLYALVQVAGRDPIAWSLKAPFATLGNINFSSAFFGLTSLCCAILAITSSFPLILRVSLALLAVVDLVIILETGSIQGFMIFVAGMGIAGFWISRDRLKNSLLNFVYLILGFCGFGLAALGLANLGPLSRFIFSETVTFRYDYWFAGWAMTLKNPLTGLGMDSYGDWYRQLRGEIATLRTTPDRITNTAHNIYLDLSSSGGFPLLIAYLFILVFAFIVSIRKFRRDLKLDPYFLAMFSAWVAYLIQAAVSINQVGVGIWGWLFTGGLLGFERVTRSSNRSSGTKDVKANKDARTKGSSQAKQIPAFTALLGIAFCGIGFVLAFIPFSADSKYKAAAQKGSPAEIAKSVQGVGATAFHYSLAMDAAIKAQDAQLAASLAKEILAKYPRDYFALQVMATLSMVPESERQEASRKLKEMDPFNPQYGQP
jgi:O-antigen ligase